VHSPQFRWSLVTAVVSPAIWFAPLAVPLESATSSAATVTVDVKMIIAETVE